jgi:hypothetical protein
MFISLFGICCAETTNGREIGSLPAISLPGPTTVWENRLNFPYRGFGGIAAICGPAQEHQQSGPEMAAQAAKLNNRRTYE